MPQPFRHLQIDQDPLVESASVVVGPVLGVGAFVIGRGAQDVEVAIEVDIDLAAIVLDDLDLVVALFVPDLGPGHRDDDPDLGPVGEATRARARPEAAEPVRWP